MILKRWEDMPEYMRVPEVRPYYDILVKKKCSLVIKRVLDYTLALIMMIICAVPMIIIAICIKADSRGPVLYRHERATTYGKIFRIHKFRTMVCNADKLGTAVTAGNDNRITKIGSKLRRVRLEGNDIIGQTTESLVNKGLREVSPIHFSTGRDLFSERTVLFDIDGGTTLLAWNQGQELFRAA